MDRMYVIITNCIFPGDDKERRKSLDHDEDERGRQQNVGAAPPGSQRGCQTAHRLPDPWSHFSRALLMPDFRFTANRNSSEQALEY